MTGRRKTDQDRKVDLGQLVPGCTGASAPDRQVITGDHCWLEPPKMDPAATPYAPFRANLNDAIWDHLPCGPLDDPTTGVIEVGHINFAPELR